MEKLLDGLNRSLPVPSNKLHGTLTGDVVLLRYITKYDNHYFHIIHKWLQEPGVFDGFLFDGDIVSEYRLYDDFLNYAAIGLVNECFIVFHNGIAVGFIVLVENHRNSVCEIGYMLIGDAYKGNGYNADAVKIITKYAFRYLNMNRISMDIISTNLMSISSIEKTGIFKHEATKREFRMVDGEPVDMHTYVCIRRDMEW